MEFLTDLYPYQQEAVDKLSTVKVGALYMDMGTGKTRTALELVSRRLERGKVDHILWLCPCNALLDIQDNIMNHAIFDPQIMTMCGIETLSSSVRANAKLRRLVAERRCYLVVDESLMVKNPQAIRSRNIMLLAESCEYKLILNGTPISRTEADLFAQWYILDWRILGYRSYWSFAANHLEIDETTGRVRRALHVDYLTSKMAPYCFEVKKEDCPILHLPPKMPEGHWFYLKQKQYEDYKRTKLEFLNSEILGTRYETVAIYRTLVALQEVASGRRIITPFDKPIEHVPAFANPLDNPRIQALLEVLDKRIKTEQAVIWCRFQHEVDDVVAVLSQRGEETAIFNGSLPSKARQAARRRFQAGTHYLIANKACGQFGLNLQFCHNAVYYNNDWNWATREQSEDRLHRNGQKYPVKIIDIIALDTIDERIMSSLARKENLAETFKQNLKEKNLQGLYDWLDGKG